MMFSREQGKQTAEVEQGQYTSVDFTSDITDIVSEVRSSIVGVQGSASGSGVIFGNDGMTVYIMTALSNVRGSETAKVVFDSGASYDGTVLGTDSATGLAVLKVETDFSTVIFTRGNSDEVDAGEYVIAVEARDDENLRSSVGLSVAGSVGFGFTEQYGTYPASIIETDLRLSSASAGSALVNAGGQLIGIVLNGIYDGDESHTYAVAVNEAVSVYNEILKDGRVERGILEITGVDVGSMRSYEKNQRGLTLDNTEGILVNSVYGNAAGILQRNDIILAVNEQATADLAALRDAEYSLASQQELTVTVQRDGNVQTVNVVAA